MSHTLKEANNPVKILIEVLPRADGFLALANRPDNSSLSEATIGGGPTEQSAAQQAINRFFARQRETSLDLAQPEDPAAAQEARHPSRNPADIRDALDRAISAGAIARITGTKVNGDRYWDRAVIPLKFSKWAGDDHLFCIDVVSTAPRSFKLSGIEEVW